MIGVLGLGCDCFGKPRLYSDRFLGDLANSVNDAF